MKTFVTLKNYVTGLICSLLLCLIAFVATDVLGQDSQYIPHPEERAEALDVVKQLIGELESADLIEDGKHYNLNLADSPVLATIGLSLFETPKPEGTRARTRQLENQLRESRVRREETRQRLESVKENTTGRKEQSYQALEDFSEASRLAREQDHYSWTGNETRITENPQMSENERRRWGLTHRQANRILKSDMLQVWRNMFSKILYDSHAHSHVSITYKAQRSGIYTDIVMDTQRSFLNIENPLTSTVHSTSLHDLINGQPVATGRPQPIFPTGDLITKYFQREFKKLSNPSQSSRVLRINRLRQGLGRGVGRLGIFIGIPYLLFVSDLLKEPRSALLREAAIFLNLPADIFENTLDGLKTFVDELIAIQEYESSNFDF